MSRSRDPAPRAKSSVDAGDGHVIGIDIGASRVSAVRVDRRGRLLARSGRVDHANAGPDAVVRAAAEAARSVQGAEEPRAVGVGVAAQVERASGRVLFAPNLAWKDFPLSDRLTETLGRPVVIENDARAALWGERRWGAGVGEPNLLMVLVGTGVGGSAVIDGHVVTGATNAFGEIGHTVLVEGGRRCHCSSQGCLEAYAGGWAIAEIARELLNGSRVPGSHPRGSLGGSDEPLTARAVIEAARSRDPLALDVMARVSRSLARGLGGVVNALNPSRLLLGGGIVEGWPELVGIVEAAIRSDCQPPARGVEVRKAELGPDLVALGAASLAWDRLGIPGSRTLGGRARPRGRSP